MPTQSEIDEVSQLLESQPSTAGPAAARTSPRFSLPSPNDVSEVESILGGPASDKNRLSMPNLGANANSGFLSRRDAQRQKYMTENQRDVPLDTDTGAGAMERFRIGLQRRPMDKLEVLRKKYGQDGVRLDDQNRFIVRTKDDQGNAKDLLFEDNLLTAKDLLDFSSEYPAIAASVIATVGAPEAKVAQMALRGAAGYLAGGAGEDVVSRGIEGRPVDALEIASHRGKEAALNAAAGYALAKPVQLLNKGLNSAADGINAAAKLRQSQAFKEVEEGRQAVKNRFGVEYDPTISDLTGSEAAARGETYVSHIPFFRKKIREKWARQAENERAVQEIMMGNQTPDVSGAGKDVIGVLRGEMEGAQNIAGAATKAVQGVARRELQDPLSKIPGGPISSSEFGASMIQRADKQLAAFKDESNRLYSAVRTEPDGFTPSDALEPLFSTGGIKQRINQIREKELINAPVESKKSSALIDEFGKPITSTESSVEPIKQLIPDRVNKILAGVEQVPEKASYFDLVKLRNRIYDEVDSPEPISSQGSRLLKNLGSAVTEEMNNAAKVLKPETVAKIDAANKFYRENVESFYEKGISDMLKPRTESGAIDPEAVATRLLAGGRGSVTTYNTVKDFFKNDASAVTDMKRVLRDRVIDSGTDSSTGLVKLESFTDAVSKMEPEIVSELFGKPKDELLKTVRTANLVLRTNSGGKLGGIYQAGSQQSFESDALKKLIDSGNLTSPAIKKLLIANESLRAQYSNAIRRAVQSNDMGVVEASPETFVNQYLFNDKIPISDLRNVMSSVYRNGDQPMIDNIRRSYLAKIFAETSKNTKGDVTQVVNRINESPARNLDVEKLSLFLQEPDTRARLKLVLGNDGFDGLVDFAKSISGRSARDKAMSLYGSLAGGAWFNKLLKGEGLSEIPHYALISHIVTSPMYTKMLKSGVKLNPLQFEFFVRTAAISPEVIQAVTTESRTPDEARRYAKELRRLATGQ